MAFYIKYLLMITCGFIMSCSDSQVQGLEHEGSRLQLKLEQSYLDTLLIDSVQFVLDGDQYLEWTSLNWESEVDLPILKPNQALSIYVKVFDEGVIRYQGDVTLVLTEEFSGVIQLELEALFRYVKMKVPLGLDNPLGISDGSLRIDSLSVNLQEQAPEHFFEIGPLSIDTTYTFEVHLWSLEGDTLFSLVDSFYLDQDTELINGFKLETVGMQASLELVILASQNLLSQLEFPQATLKRAEDSLSLVLSELMVQPTSTGSGLEYVELYNNSFDTLDLDSCALTKSRGSTSTSSRVLLSSFQLAPQETMVVGGEEVPEVDLTWDSFSLVNTRGSLLLFCEGQVLDSIFYETSADSSQYWGEPLGSSYERDWSQWGLGSMPSQWCLSSADWSPGDSLQLKGSPGLVQHCF